jgi:cobalamin biosynthesis protein CobT
MNFSQESKSQLAKLMATENIRVEHRKMQTAAFDLKNRTLYCPIWTDMSGELYDLLLGHEVGHALETPEEGWHNAVTSKDKKISRNFKHFLNVVEDARIEKKIKRRFPGLRNSFVKAYGELLSRDFFGLGDRDINTFPFIDRLNVYTKGGISTGVKFTDEESEFVRKVEAAETWDDVVEITGAIFDYSKQDQQKQNKLPAMQFSMDMDEMDDGEFSESDYDSDQSDDSEETTGNGPDKETDGSSDSGSGKETNGSSEDGEQKPGNKKSNADAQKSDEKSEDTKPGNQINRFKPTQSVAGQDDFEPTCETDEAYRENEYKLLDEKSKDYSYMNVPTPIMSEILTPASIVHKQMQEFWSPYLRAEQDALVKDFKNNNDRYISLLAKEFEMRKAAEKFSKTKVSNTGDIDVNRIYKYQIDDNIFKKMNRVPKGKSHGLILLLDRSGSMKGQMAAAIEQILILVMFCRKVNIPFVVYGFGNETDGFKMDHGRTAKDSFTRGENELAFSHVFLREYFNSRMGNVEFNNCVRNMVTLADAYSKKNYGDVRNFRIPLSEPLSATPMMEAMVALKPLTEQFRKVNNLDIVDLALIHDGDADEISYHYVDGGTNTMYNYFNSKNYVLVDTKTKFQKLAPSGNYDTALRSVVFDWYRNATGAKIIGFYIAGTGASARSNLSRRYTDSTGQNLYEKYPDRDGGYHKRQELAKKLTEDLKEERFVESFNHGYNKFFFIPGDADLQADDGELEISGSFTASKLKNAFIKMNKKKQVSRVLVNRFITEIAV